MKSMTGYAKRQGVVGERKITIELRTLNSKTLDLNVKVPASLRGHEVDLRRMLNALQRGKVDLFINEEGGGDEKLQLNKELLISQYRAAQQLQEALSIHDGQVFSTLLRQPDAWIRKDETSDENYYRAVDELMAETVSELDQTRSDEGAILERDIMLHVDAIEQRLHRIEQYEGERITVARERIKKYFDEFAIKEIDPNRFEQEIIYYLEKLDITEEKVRLQKHIDYFRQTVREEEASGKKLAFIAQEMGREINTTGSKSNHVDMQKLVVEMKDELEKIKEQLGNIL